MRTHQGDKLIAWVGIYPYAVLHSDESSTQQEPPKLVAHAPASFIDVEDEHPPLPIPKSWLRYRVLAELYFFNHLPSFFRKNDAPLRIRTRHSHETSRLKSGDTLVDAPVELRPGRC